MAWRGDPATTKATISVAEAEAAVRSYRRTAIREDAMHDRYSLGADADAEKFRQWEAARAAQQSPVGTVSLPLTDAVLNGFRVTLIQVQEAEQRVRAVADRILGPMSVTAAANGAASQLAAVPGSMSQEIDAVARQLDGALYQLRDTIDRLNAI